MPFSLSHPTDTAERVEGEPFYQLSEYTIADSDDLPSQWRALTFRIRAFKVLPPCDAVGLLSGDDSTGLVVWSGALALVEWLLRRPEELKCMTGADTAATSSSSCNAGRAVHLVELGCGSGIATVGLYALLLRHRRITASICDRPVVHSRVHLWATDGNPECVELAARNVREQCCDNGEANATDGVTASAALLPWGDTAATRSFIRSCGTANGGGGVALLQDASATSLSFPPSLPPLFSVVSADVLYDAAAVPLLVATVADFADSCAAAHTEADSQCGVTWWLAYTPRSLTRAGNELIYQTLLDAFEKRSWRYEVHTLPANSVTTGFESRADCDTPALRGCVLVIHATPTVLTVQ